MIHVKIDDTQYQADEAVVKRMQEYYDTMCRAIKAYDALHLATEKVRRLQKAYYSNRMPGSLAASKAAEKDLDALLEPKEKKKERLVTQELFR